MNKIVIKYQTHQVLTNKNSLTEMNRKLRKIETPHNQTHWANIISRTKIKSRKLKENNEQGKDYLTITGKHRMENSQDGNGKNKSSNNYQLI